MNLQEDRNRMTEVYISGINDSNLELYRIMRENLEEIRPIYPLIEFIVDRLCTVSDLAIRDRNWDAEIIYRSALEALIKLTYITSAIGEEQQKREKEYWTDLCDINALKQSEQAKKNVKLFLDDENMTIFFTPMILSEDREKEIRDRLPKKERQRIEREWSFTNMIGSLSKNFYGESADFFLAYAHGYRNASHVLHGDETGVLIIRERMERPEDERMIADMAHLNRLLSDSFQFCVFIGLQVSKYLQKDANFFKELVSCVDEANKLGKIYSRKLQEDKVYDKYRK